MTKKVVSLATNQPTEEQLREDEAATFHMLGFVRLEFPDDIMYMSQNHIQRVIYKKKTREVIVTDCNDVEYHTTTKFEEILEQVNQNELRPDFEPDTSGEEELLQE